MSYSYSGTVFIDSRHSPSYHNNKNSSNNDNSNNIPYFAQTGTYGVSYKNMRRKCTHLGMRSGTRLRCSLKSDGSNCRQLEVLIAAVKFMEVNWP